TLIHNSDAGRGLCSLFEHVSHPGGADSDKHFDKVRAADAEKRHIRLARYCAGQKRLTGTRRTDHQNSFRNPAAKFLKLFWIFKKIDDFLDFFLRLLDTGYIFEGHTVPIAGKHSLFALAEIQRALAGLPYLVAEAEI